MKFSFTLFGIDPPLYAPMARRAEELGFEAIWVADHVIVPLKIESIYGYSATGRPSFAPDIQLSDPWVTIGCLAGVTTRIKLGTAVYLLPLRNPFVTARTVATAQNLSGGRVMLGIGAGWMKEEFDALGEDFASRGARTDEILDILDKLWSGRPVEHQGRHYHFQQVQFGGAPVQKVPLIFGGHSAPVLRRAAARGHGWIAGTQPLDEMVSIKRAIDDLRRAAGREKEPFDYYPRLLPPVTGERIRQYEDAGFEHIVLAVRGRSASLHATTLAGQLESLDDTANAVVASGYGLG